MKKAQICAAGMTLIELMIAIAIASTLAVAGFRALSALTSSASILTETTQRWQSLDAAAAAFERAYRRAAPGAIFTVSDVRVQVSEMGDDGNVSERTFGATDDTIARWRFAAWENGNWSAQWRNTQPPRGIKLTLTTTRGDTVERTYAR